MKAVVGVALLCVGIFTFNWRYLAPEAGIASRSPDYSTHISIEQHLKKGQFFPEFYKNEKGLHAVSKYLPVYHGLLGFHVSSWILECLGMPLPGAHLLLMDLSLLIYLLFFASILLQEMRREKRWEYIVAIVTIATLFLTHFARAVDEGFFPQIMTYALLLASWKMWMLERRGWSIFFVLFATWTYPDFLVWLLPIFALDKRNRLHLVARIGLSLLWCFLIYTLFNRRNLPGPEAFSLYPLIFLLLVLILFGKNLYQQDRNFFFCLGSFTIVTIGFLFAAQENFTWGYYANKVTYPATILLIYAFSTVSFFKTQRGRIFLALYVFFFWSYAELNWFETGRYFGRGEIVNNKFYASVIKTTKEIEGLDKNCLPEQSLVLPFEADVSEDGGMLGVWVRNSLLLNSDINSGYFNSPSLRAIYGQFKDYEKSYRQSISLGDEFLFSVLKNLPPLEQDICIVSPERTRSMFNDNSCFEIIKEQGGQIYAQCKAQAKL